MDAKNNDEADIQQKNDDEYNGKNRQEQSDDSSSQQSEKDQARSSSPKPQHKPKTILAAVDMTGSVISPISSKPGSKREGDESLLKARYRYSNFQEDEEGGSSYSMDLLSSRQSLGDNNTSAELMVQQIYDQRSKLSAGSKQAGALSPPPVTHQVSSLGTKSPRLQSSNSPIAPGAYSVELPNSARSRNDDNDHLGNDGHGSSVMQLEAVPVDETLEQAKLQQMEEQMNREIERRLSLERKMTQEQTHHSKSCVKERMPIAMALVIILSAISVGLYFLLASTSDDVAADAGSSSNFIYPPPTTEECEAVRNGATVPNQDNYPSVMMESTVDVSFYAEFADSVNTVLMEVQRIFEYVALPALIGCNGGVDQEYFNQTFSPNRYIIANLDVLNVTRSTSSDCTADEPIRPCVRVVFRYFLWTKTELPVLELVSFMQSNFGPALIQSSSHDSEIIHQTTLVSISISPSANDPIPKNDTIDEEPNDDLLYPPPTVEECQAMINGVEVPNQDQYSTMTVDAAMDVTTYDDLEDSIDTLLLEMLAKMGSSVLPTLMGCSDTGEEALKVTKYTETRYILANADIVQVKQSDSNCNPTEPQPCARVEVRFLLWLKGEVELFDLIPLVHNDFRLILVESLTQSDIIEQVVLASIGPGQDDSPPNLDNGINVDFKFPSPTEERCEAVSNGIAIENQDSYFSMLADVKIDVSTHAPWEDSLDLVLLEIGNQFQTIAIPTLAGCQDTEEKLLNSTVTADRYMMVNSVVLNVTKSSDDCNGKEPRPCVRAIIHLQIWTMEEVRIFDVISAVDQNYGPSVVAKLGTGNKTNHTDSIIKQVEMVSLSSSVGG
ncbi:unnamed protein product [Cylindrotheca closterium]|uniref:Uncharacterized protein n=1 Tax=Cylindrotheca closterium TaxID=2856 RepID=A0AAD2CKI8_9STRA|nr:unnamed protein product [Cylindrotheca closterium]